MMITRREFLKLALAGLALLWRPSPTRAQEPEPEPEPAQEWGFPLAFPAYFPETSEPQVAGEIPHTTYLPLVAGLGLSGRQ